MKKGESLINVFVLSKLQMRDLLNINNINDDNVDSFKNIRIISINDFKGGFYHEPFFKNEHYNVLTLYFDDVERDFEQSPTNYQETKAFSIEDARKIIDFLANINDDVKTIFIHCAAGISRSGAIGQFCSYYLNVDKDHFKIHNSHIMPNGRVLRMLNNEILKYEV